MSRQLKEVGKRGRGEDRQGKKKRENRTGSHWEEGDQDGSHWEEGGGWKSSNRKLLKDLEALKWKDTLKTVKNIKIINTSKLAKGPRR